MCYKYFDMETYKRKNHFEYFNSLAYPYVGITVNVDITEFLDKVHSNKVPFFLAFCYCVYRAGNGVTEFRHRIKDNKIIEFENCQTSHTVALDDGTYCYCNLDGNMPFEEYISYAVKKQELAKQDASVSEDETEALNKFFISCLP